MMRTSIESWPVLLIILSSFISFASGIPILFGIIAPAAGQRISAGLMALSSLTGLTGAISVLVSQTETVIKLNWHLPMGPMICSVDSLSAFFMIPVFIITACASIYSIGYWPAKENLQNIRRLTFFLGALTSAILWVVMAGSAALFLFAWEIMAISAFFVLTADDSDTEVREAGILYLICTHIGTLALFVLFAVLNYASGSFAFPDQGSVEAGNFIATVLFFLGIFGFGIKAGIMPFHVWLPSAHANAPSHVSAVMSGIILKIGIYGILRLLSFFRDIPLWWGITILTVGVVSGVLGVVFAIAQHDLKRLLAYHSIENIGIIMMGIGISLIGISEKSSILIMLGMAGALLHVMNHATFKALLFLGAGSVIHAVGTREIDRMGGLLRKMPWTAAFFLTGAVAICGLPPLNGFVSEFFIYLGLFSNAAHGNGASAAACALAAPSLALIGGLALACFVKVFGVVFLGTGRFQLEKHAHEAGLSMCIPMAVLASICIFIGVAPFMIAPVLESAVSEWNHSAAIDIALAEAVPFKWISIMAIALISVIVFLYFAGIRKASSEKSSTWGCGYAEPTPRMQYTASSFANTIIGLFTGVLCPATHKPEIKSVFPKRSKFSSHVPETVLERIYLPLLHRVSDRLTAIRKLQHGHLHFYILYIFLTLIALMMIPE